MTPTEISAMLVGISAAVPVYYDHADNGVKVPFIEWTFSSTSNFNADNTTYKEVFDVRVCFYSIVKDMTTEGLIKSTLTDNDLPFSHKENHIDDEKLYQEIFTFSVIDGNKLGGN